MLRANVKTSTSANGNIMRRFVDEVINSKCLEVIDEIVHPDYVYRTPEQELHGRQALKALFTTFHTAFPDLNVRIDELISTDDKVVLLFTLTGTHQTEFMGIPATGKPVNINGMLRSRFDAGQIIEEWELLDQLSMLQQLDIVPVN
ncbi:MAG: ester cyclase [Gammaproteobacteria bacterium]|nr:ester cyclase [Gammaproteobacteria bacterium]